MHVSVPVIIFGLVGIFLLWYACWDSLRTWRQRHLFIRTIGQVTHIESAMVVRSRASFPVIRFMNQEGRVISFKSSVGYVIPQRPRQRHRYKPPYRIGQNIAVCYDPGGVLPPMIDSWMTRWLSPLSTGVGGALFLALAWRIWVG